MSPKPFVIKPDDRKAALNVLGTQVTILASGDDMSDQRVTLQAGDEGTGPPPHSHDWDESFYVLKGGIEFLSGGETHACEPGTLVFVPGGSVHGFRYGPGGGQMLEITGDGSLAVQMFTAINNEVSVD